MIKINSIQFKIITLIIFLFLLLTLIVVFLTAYNQRNYLFNEAEIELFMIADILQSTIKNLMLKGEAPIAVSTMSDYKNIQELLEVDIYRVSGDAAFVDYKTLDFVNNYQTKFKFDKTQRVKEKMSDNINFKKVIKDELPLKNELIKEGEMEYFLPLRNVYECWQCHGEAYETGSLRGVAYLKISLKPTYIRIQNTITVITFILIISGSIIIILFILLLQKLIIQPLLKIGNRVKQFGDGNLDINVDIKSKDELGDLSTKLNEMFVHVKERISLSKYVSKSTNDMIKKGIKVESTDVEKKNITVLFSDIRGFTSYSESNSPDTVIKNLNKILQIQSDIVHNNSGDVDKFVGDELMAVFNDEYNAVKAAYEIIINIIKLNKQNNTNLFVGIGINSGEVIAGNVGSENRLEYAVIGDTVNLASRLCGIAKENMVLISESVYEKVKDKIEAKIVENQIIKGKSNMINFYIMTKLK